MAELIIVTYNEDNEIKTSMKINMSNPARQFKAITADGQRVTIDAYDRADAQELADMQNMTLDEPRTLDTIAREIARDPAYSSSRWCAEPYRSAMASLTSLSDRYGMDSAESVILYFLSNTAQWRGETARRIKAELRAMLKESKR